MDVLGTTTLSLCVLTLWFCDWHEWQCVTGCTWNHDTFLVFVLTHWFCDWHDWQCVSGCTWNRDTFLVFVLTLWLYEWLEWQCVRGCTWNHDTFRVSINFGFTIGVNGNACVDVLSTMTLTSCICSLAIKLYRFGCSLCSVPFRSKYYLKAERERERERERDRERQRQTDRQTDRQTETHTEIQTQTERDRDTETQRHKDRGRQTDRQTEGEDIISIKVSFVSINVTQMFKGVHKFNSNIQKKQHEIDRQIIMPRFITPNQP